MRGKIIGVMTGLFVALVLGFSVYGGADKITPEGTLINIAPLEGVLTGAAKDATLSIQLLGSNNVNPSLKITGSAKVIAQGETTLNGQTVTKATTLLDLAGNNTYSFAKDEYFGKEDGKFILVGIIRNGQPIAPPIDVAPLPVSDVRVGDSGLIATFLNPGDGSSIESRWYVVGASNNEVIFQVKTTITKGVLLATETTDFYLNSAGIPKDFVWKIETADGKIGTFSGKIKTQKLGAKG